METCNADLVCPGQSDVEDLLTEHISLSLFLMQFTIYLTFVYFYHEYEVTKRTTCHEWKDPTVSRLLDYHKQII